MRSLTVPPAGLSEWAIVAAYQAFASSLATLLAAEDHSAALEVRVGFGELFRTSSDTVRFLAVELPTRLRSPGRTVSLTTARPWIRTTSCSSRTTQWAPRCRGRPERFGWVRRDPCR